MTNFWFYSTFNIFIYIAMASVMILPD